MPSGRVPCSDGVSDSSRRKPVREAGWRKCVGVEPTGRRFPDVPLALKARRVTGPYSLPHPDYNGHSIGREN